MLRFLVVLGVFAVLASGCGASAPRERDAVPFARRFVAAVFPEHVPCSLVQHYSRAGFDVCDGVTTLPHYHLQSEFPTSVAHCTSLTADGRTLSDVCVSFAVIARTPTQWADGTLSVGVGNDHRGRLVIDGVSLNDGGSCIRSAVFVCRTYAEEWAERYNL